MDRHDLLPRPSEPRQLELELDDVTAASGAEMAELIRKNTHRYKKLLESAVDECMPQPTVHLRVGDIADVLMQSRTTQANDENSTDANQQMPPRMKRRWQIAIIPESKHKTTPLRAVKAESIGHLVSVKGIVTRVSEVKAQICVATYTCETGGWEIYQEVNDRSFMPLFRCPAANCCNHGRLHLQTRGCKFEKFQEVKIQEEADQVPVGHVPRSLTLHLYGELVRSCSAGDVVTVAGIFLPVPYTGFKAMRAVRRRPTPSRHSTAPGRSDAEPRG